MKTNKWINKGLIATFLLISIVGCKKDKDDTPVGNPLVADYNRVPLLTNLANNYIVPAYNANSTQTDLLKSKIGSFVTSSSITTLQDMKTQWVTTLLTWQDVAFLEFGPASTISYGIQTNIYPTNIATIQSNIASGSYNLQSASNFDAKGYQALDYLINGVGNTDQEIIDFYTIAANSANAKTYLQDVINELSANASTVSNQWQTNYAATFIASNSDNSVGSSVSDVLNALIAYYEVSIRKGKVGIPVGVFNGISQQPMPNNVEALYYKQSLPFAVRGMESIKKFVNGISYTTSVNGEGFDDYLNFVQAQSATTGQALSTSIVNQMGIIVTGLNGLNDPFDAEVVNNNPAVIVTYTEMQKIIPEFKVEMTSALGVLITFQDNDGD